MDVASAAVTAPRRDWLAFATRHRALLAALFLLVFPLLMPFKAIAVNILIYGLFALGFNMLYSTLPILTGLSWSRPSVTARSRRPR